MRARWPGPAAGRRLRPLQTVCATASVIGGLLVVGCGGPATKPTAQAMVTSCGTTRTAAAVPVHIQVRRGSVSCTTAMTVERAYAKDILDGHAPGNGGGGPVTVHGWTCQGFATPVVLKTGKASRCVQGSSEILAVLPTPA